MKIEQAKLIAAQVNVGYWQVQNECFFSKTEALREATRKKSLVKYWYFDELYRVQSKEPTENIDELYDIRAKQIRDKYDYVAMAISGGADSTNMLQAFLRCNLRIDEVITYYPITFVEKLLSAFDGTTSPHNMIFEYEYAFKPLMEKVQRLSPSTKITVLDHSKDALDMVSKHKVNYAYHDVSRTTNFAGMTKLVDYFREAEHPNSCIVHGSDKPVILYDTENQKCFVIFDDFTNGYNVVNLLGGINLEAFYFTKDAPSILRKQYADVNRAVKKHLLTSPLDQIISKRSTDLRFKLLDMKNPILENAIYPSLWEIKFQAEKAKFTLFNESGSWLFHDRFKNETQTNLADFWKGQILDFVSGIDSRFLEYKNRLPVKFKPCQSSWFSYHD